MGAKGSNQVSQTQTMRPTRAVRAAGEQALTQAQTAASQPFQQPQQPVAPFTPYQTQAFNQIAAMQGMTDPYFASAGQQFGEAGTPITQDDIERYLNPYADAALGNMNKYIFGPQRVQTMGQARSRAGGPSADRLALTSQNLDFTQADALSQALAGFYSPAMAQAQRAKEMALTTGQSWANLGTGAQNAALQATNALGTAGGQQQQQAQAEAMAPYQLELARLAYPYQQAQFLSGVTGQVAPSQGGTTSGTTTYPSPSPLNQAIGLGTAAAGAFMGNPAMVSGGLKGASGGSNYAYSPPQGLGSFNPVYMPGYGYMPQAANRGGRTYARGGSVDDTQNWISEGFRMARDAFHGSGTSNGGSVNPFHMGEGFDFGGPVIDADYTVGDPEPPTPFADRWQESSLSPAGNVDARFGEMASPNYAALSPAANVDARFGQGEAGSFASPFAIKPLINQGNARFQEMQEGPTIPPELHGKIYGNAPPAPVESQAAEAPVERPQITIPRGVRPLPQKQTQADPSVDLERLLLPQSRTPYPDALERDWGQKAVRSPWMALIEGGAKIAQTTGPVGSAIGAGIQEGSKTLQGQRKELRSEQAINQRAQSLYRDAQAELRRYQQNKFQQMPYATGEGHPVAFDVGKGRAYNAVTGEPIVPGVPLSQTSRASAGRSPAMVATAEWMVANGISPDKETAFNRLKEGVSDKARAATLIKEYVKIIMQADPLMPIEEAKKKAEDILRGAQSDSP